MAGLLFVKNHHLYFPNDLSFKHIKKNMEAVVRKCKFKNVGIVIGAPVPLQDCFVQLGFKTKFTKTKSSNTMVFIDNKKAFEDFLNTYLKNIEPDSILWFAYPKGTSKIKTDINRDILRMTGESFGITTVMAISIDETWSALRFRPIDKVGK